MKTWFLDDVDLGSAASEFLDSKKTNGEMSFQMFLNSYIVDLTSMTQKNRLTGFVRPVQKIEKKQSYLSKISQSLNFKSKLKINVNDLDIQDKSGTQFIQSSKAKIIIDSFDEKNATLALDALEDEVKSNLAEKSFEIPKNLDEKVIQLLSDFIKKEELTLKIGKILPGSKITLAGFERCIEKLDEYFKVIELAPSSEYPLPNNWGPQDKNCILVELGQYDQEYLEVKANFESTASNRTLKKVFRIQNQKLYRDFLKEIKDNEKLREQYKLSPKTVKQMLLWHGTKETDPKLIYESIQESFEFLFAKDGMWGKGLYFAVNASYSINYAHQAAVQNSFLSSVMSMVRSSGTQVVNQMMLVDVIVGDEIEMAPDTKIVKAPVRKDVKEVKLHYDSIKGNTNGSDVYILKVARRAYPKYLIEFE